MGEITFARVDSRLIHGQVVTKWAKSSGANVIYIVDDKISQDSFTKEIYQAAGSSYGFKVKVFSAEEVLAKWQADHFGADKVFLLFSDVPTALTCLNQDLPIPVLNLGGMPLSQGKSFFIKNIALSQSEMRDLRQLAQAKQIVIYAQTVPDAQRKNL